MNLVSSFVDVLQQVSCVMTVPTFSSFVTVVTGWVFARRHTITGALVAADAVKRSSGRGAVKHHSAFHRLFAQAEWVLDDLGLAVFELIEPWLGKGAVMLALEGADGLFEAFDGAGDGVAPQSGPSAKC